MQIIPVIDLLNGVVVHAKRGQRAAYQPIQSQLTTSSAPLDIVAALLALYPFTQLYIADLNAIQHLGDNNFDVIEAIAARYPTLELWLDAGFSHFDELKTWQHLNVRPILGSENFAQLNDYLTFKTALLETKFILSLDFMPENILGHIPGHIPENILAKNNAAASQYSCGFQGSAQLLNNAQFWPQDVIVMSLANVGANQGANGELLREMLNFAPTQNVYAAGGVRGLGDLVQLKKMGVSGALIATALHQKQLSSQQLTSLAQQIA